MTVDPISAHARQFRRHATRYEARIEVHPDHAGQFRLSFPDAYSGLAVVDVSQGGLALCTSFYMPKNLRVRLCVSGATTESEYRTRELTVSAVVRRCVMTDYKPTYQVGLQFLDASGQDERQLVQSVVSEQTPVGEPAALGGARAS
jgi:c-di-GMP-binding flagellar brake protein YcgR